MRPAQDPASGVPQSSTSPVLVSRPAFSHRCTADRLREASVLPFKMGGNIQKGRQSIFKEVGLDDETSTIASPSSAASDREFTTSKEEHEIRDSIDSTHFQTSDRQQQGHDESEGTGSKPISHHRRQSVPSKPWYARLPRPRFQSSAGDSAGRTSMTIPRFTMIAMLIAVIIPAFSFSGRYGTEMSGAEAGALIRRQSSPTKICKRWAHQAANLNGTLYIYGGEAATEEHQEENTWNNNFLTLDLNKNWDTDSPALKGLEIPDGPPKVTLGYLWQDYSSLYLYGGSFSGKPFVQPGPASVWKYSIKNTEWSEITDPETSKGNASDPEGQPVQRSSEGAGVSVPELGKSWYFGGHLDWSTTAGWSNQTERVYLKSLLEFTHPGYANTGIDNLRSAGAGDNGAFRNITSGGVQAGDFSERADGVLVFVPGWGDMGVLIGMAGGTAEKFTDDLRTLDVYDIANSEWYHQETSGDAPSVRVNPCAVIASAPDASSFQIYMFGGQNLQPAGDQTQYDDMYILTIPSFVWIKVDSSDNTPAPRAGHTCHIRDAQMVIVGGYTGRDAPCESPGIHVFDLSKLEWADSFKAADHNDKFSEENIVLAGSYGYSVPDAVQKKIGGKESGGATATAPAVSATGGPFVTGRSPVFTITQSGATTVVTQTGSPESGSSSGDDNNNNDDSSGTNPGLIAAGVAAGVFGALALYLGFCAWVYRRQVSAYKQHLAVANRYSGFSSNHMLANAAPPGTNEEFGWVGSRTEPAWLAEPKWNSDEVTPSGSASASGSGGNGYKRSNEDRRGSASGESTEGLLDGHEPSFFSVVMKPRRALRVVNGLDERNDGQ